MRKRRAAGPAGREGGMNELMRRLLWLPEQASTFAAQVDTLHYFVITVTMIASVADRPAGVLLLLQVPRAPGRTSRRRSSSPACKFEVLVIGVPLFFFLLWFVHGLQGLRLVHDAAQERDGRLRDGQEVDVEVRLRRRRPNAIGTLRVPAQPPGAAAHDRRDVSTRSTCPTSASSRTCCPAATPRPGSRRPSPGRYQILCAEYCGTWHSQMWGEVVVMPRAGVRRVDGRAEARASPSASTPAATTAASMRGSIVEYGKKVAMAAGLPQVPLAGRAAAHRPDLAGPLPAPRDALEGGETVVADEAYLTESMMDPRAKVVEGFKPVMPTYQGRLAARGGRARRVHQVAAQHRASRTCPSKDAMYEPAKPARRQRRAGRTRLSTT